MSNETHCPPVVGPDLRMSSTDRSVGSTVSLTCHDGFRLSGVERITCVAGGVWTSDGHPRDFPTCNSIVVGIDDVWIIVVCLIATVMALAVVFCAVYMLCLSFNDSKKKLDNTNEMRNDKIRSYLAEAQNYVWSPGDAEEECPRTDSNQQVEDCDDDDTSSMTSASGTTETGNDVTKRQVTPGSP